MSAPFQVARRLDLIEGVTHGFFGRQGGVSTGVFASLNVSETGGDSIDQVADNRAIAANALGFTAMSMATLKQTHSTRVITLREPPPIGARPDADALVTALPGVLLGILTADCTPILFADAETGIIGAAHAGWKGAVDGIAPATIAAMEALGARRETIVAAIGPTISARNYEVGPQFKADFLALQPGAEGFFSTPDGGLEHFDLPGFVASQIRAAGVTSVEDIGTCTYADPARYFSHRYATHHDQTTGRQIALIALDATH